MRAITAILFATLLWANAAWTQDGGKWGIGLDAGAQKLYGDRKVTRFGGAFQGFVTYRALKFMDLALSVGYGVLNYDVQAGVPVGGVPLPATVKGSTNIINADLRGNLELISSGMFRPYITLGLGVVNFKVNNGAYAGRFYDGALIGGVGFNIKISPKIGWLVSADYRYLTGDSIDHPNLDNEGKAKDGYLNLRTGIAYRLGASSSEEPELLADDMVPLEEIDGIEAYGGLEQTPGMPSGNENEAMEEYIRLKSRIDELTQTVDSQENEVSRLHSELSQRKQRLASLERTAADRPRVARTTSSSLSGFSQIYEEALAHYYSKNYEEAISLLRLLTEKYPNHSLASSYHYWLGRCLLALDRYQEAISSFYQVLNYDRSFKKDDALFYLGRAYLKLGEGPSAKESFARLIREYPSSEYVAEAQTYMEKL